MQANQYDMVSMHGASRPHRTHGHHRHAQAGAIRRPNRSVTTDAALTFDYFSLTSATAQLKRRGGCLPRSALSET